MKWLAEVLEEIDRLEIIVFLRGEKLIFPGFYLIYRNVVLSAEKS